MSDNMNWSLRMEGAPTSSPPADGLRIVEMDALSDPRWEAYVTAHPDGSVFLHPAWLQVLTRGSNQTPVCLACVDETGSVYGVLPLVETSGFWFNLGPATIKRRLSSLPRTPVAGPLATGPESASLLIQAAMEQARKLPGAMLELKLGSVEVSTRVSGLATVAWADRYVLELPANPSELRFGNNVTRHRIKWAVKKASSMGVTVRCAENKQDLRAWYELYLDTMRWHSAIPRPYTFFVAMWEILRPKGLLRLLLAEQCREGDRRLLSGYLLLMAGKTVCCYVNGRRREDLGLHPNDIIQWQAIHDACREGYKKYDFLDVEGLPGLAEFKLKWGAKPVPSYRCYAPAPDGLEGSPSGEPSAVTRFASAVWRKLPLGVTEVIGRWAHGYL